MACTSFNAGTGAVVTNTLGTVVTNPCPQTIQALAQAIINALTSTLPGNFATFNIGSDVPSPENRDKLWYKVDASCNPLGWFIWTGAAWTSAQPLGSSPGTVEHYWSSSLVGLTVAEARAAISFRDTGDAYSGAPSTTLHTNPFWLLCDGTTVGGFTTPDLQGRVIVGAGAGSGLTSRAVNDSGGEENHTLIESELASHKHAFTAAAQVGIGLGGAAVTDYYGSIAIPQAPGVGREASPAGPSTGNIWPLTSPTPSGAATGHNTMQPYRCIYPVVRTNRTI